MPFVCCDSTIYRCNNNLVHKMWLWECSDTTLLAFYPFLDNGSRSKVRMFYAQGCFMHKCVSGMFIGSSFLSIATGNYCTSIETFVRLCSWSPVIADISFLL